MKLFVTLLFIPNLVWADGVRAVEAFFAELETLQGGFQQQVRDGSGQMIEESFGTIQIQRPGKFHWQTSQPFVQVVVGDGDRIWIYDPDLEQVTVRRQDGALGNTPATLLTHEGALQQQFSLHPLDRVGHLSWVELTPKQGEGGFEQLLVAMDGEQLRIIQVEDSLGQRTRIELLDLMTNISLPDERFQFTPADGVDVVGDL
ncbi:MAG: outer membrane lipoprotein chaperone LolA [Gammaproteobacteria bacterium]|nr:outer membrane lipoprotein chaperone LolA [Gammaproteobacteria bacterium]MBT4606101.1 outer membrane lipoprotein chaperone LolA [Thiotrichales bacterium]MBT3967610.1 outer membrane lipoprotein chaperone LolA [Gammaproteobacteria bacterium]MBT4079470.1 outer membrane lipoprotein chaperone LolA [Gammaproteobacteria bacterium]MBT4810683.1 outer membrane lipoprotein chaperone LolA [Thiotrichales bacterium]